MKFNSERTFHTLLLLSGIVLIALVMFALDRKFQKMQHDCEVMGGKFYSISFTENICVEGERVRKLD